MTIPFWCVLVAGLLPYVWGVMGAQERRRQFGAIDNKQPRAQEAALTGRGARIMGAHNNAFETFPLFAAAVLVAHLAGADASSSASFALAFVALRVAHGVLYVADLDVPRSLAFGLAQLCSVSLFVLAARAA